MSKLGLRRWLCCTLWLLGLMGMAFGQTTDLRPTTPGSQASAELAEAEVESEILPPAVIESAVKAVAELGMNAVQGKFQTALEKMYPQWRSQSAARSGGEAKFAETMARIPAEMAKAGVTIVSCKPEGTPIPLEVGPGMRKVQRHGKPVMVLAYTKWLVLVPTVTVFRVIHQAPGQAPKRVVIESTGFQVAVSDKTNLDWTFIDGSSVTIRDLRAMFGTLPADLKLPPLSKREVR